MSQALKILFLCTGNSCRSQMAEGWSRHLKGDSIAPFSAGTQPKDLDPRAAKVMAEVGVDISDYRAKSVDEVLDVGLDYVVTVCDGAHETCPIFPGRVVIRHVGFEDPPALAQNASSEEEALDIYRRVRDEIRVFIETLPGVLEDQGPAH